jgi:hypothetical protein
MDILFKIDPIKEGFFPKKNRPLGIAGIVAFKTSGQTLPSGAQSMILKPY